MNIKKIGAFERTLGSATCPMDLFGEAATRENILRRIQRQGKLLKEASAGKKDANLEYRISLMMARFGTLAQWALETIRNGTYSQRLPYRVKLRLAVKRRGGKTYFFVEGAEDLEVFFTTLDAAHFEGYLRCDPVHVFRSNKKLWDGSVHYYGTHAAQEYFMRDDGDMVPHLKSSDFEANDTIEIETLKYASPRVFARDIIGFFSLSSSLDAAFRKHKNSLDNSQLSAAVKEGDASAAKKLQEKKVFVFK